MNYHFTKKSSLSRFVSLTLIVVMMLTMLVGCSLIPSKTPTTEAPSESTEDTTPSSEPLNIVEETETTEAPTTEETEPPTTEPKKENIAIVKEQMNLYASPSKGSRVNAELDAGDEIEIIRMDSIGTTSWAYAYFEAIDKLGWVTTDMLDLSNVQIAANSTTTPANTTPTTDNDATQPTTSAPINNITGTGTTNTPANSQVATVTANTLNIRQSASTNSDRVGAYTYGDRITILETSNGWGRTDKGWVSMNYVSTSNQQNTNTNPTPVNPGNTGNGNATITGSNVNVRASAGTAGTIVGTVSQGESVNILETTVVDNRQWGRMERGWVCMDYVSVTGNIGPSGAVTTGNVVVTSNGLHIRSDAGTNFPSVGSLSQGQTVNVLETKVVGTSQWGRIQEGWICLDYVRMK